jgi:hypothetical protein
VCEWISQSSGWMGGWVCESARPVSGLVGGRVSE